MVNKRILLITLHKEFPGGPVVRTWHFDCSGSIPGWGTKILQWGQKINTTKKQTLHILGGWNGKNTTKHYYFKCFKLSISWRKSQVFK